MLDWSEIVHHCDQIHARYPGIWSLRLVRRNARFPESHFRQGKRVLDIGVRNSTMEKQGVGMYPGIVCKSMRANRTVFHEYHSLDEIDEQFEFITFFEVIEHLELEEGVEMLGRLHQLLVDGGTLLISTPNIYNPALHAVHKTAYSYEELGGLLLSQGFDVHEIYRTYNASRLKYIMCFPLLYPVRRILNADFAQSIVALAHKGGAFT